MVNFTFILRYNVTVSNSFQLSIMLHITSDSDSVMQCPVPQRRMEMKLLLP